MFFSRNLQEIRQELLTLNGIGPETADSILLYAGNQPIFVIDAYTKRIITRIPLLIKGDTYDEIQNFFEKELKKSVSTFVGVPFFTNHQNNDVEKAKGKIVYAEWNEKDKSIYVIAFVDREAYPHLCRGIEEGYVNGVSMGCSVEYSVCSICKNKAASQDDYCSHIKNLKGRKFTGRVTDVVTGQTREIKDAHVYEDNFGIRFIELSGVVDPACASCKIKDVYQNDKLAKAAVRCANDISVLQTVENFQKNASKEDVDKLNQALNILQEIAIKLIQNRANIEMEFSLIIIAKIIPYIFIGWLFAKLKFGNAELFVKYFINFR
jgi:hypothetical protein